MNPPEALGREDGYGAADIHIHSSTSDGMASVSEILEYVARKGELDVIAIADHDEITGAYEARELVAKRNYPFEVIVGMELNTREGHLLALYLESPVPSHQPVIDSVAAVHEQGGLCIAPHPMSMLSESLSHRDIQRVIESDDPKVYLDGIETINATIVGRISNRRAKKINRIYQLAETGSSDAHFLISVGTGVTLFPGHTAEDLRRSILEGTTRARNGKGVSYFDIGLLQIIKQQRKSGGFFVRGMMKNFTRRFSR
jgi:predicted metal-dependent phosphoesterase TrpH